MECPNCGKTAKSIGEEMPRAHLNVGTSIMWCSICGTVFRSFNFTTNVRDIMIPERGKS